MPSRFTTAHEARQSQELAVYLNDHLGGATAGVELAHRLSEAQAGTARAGGLEQVAAEVGEDRASLLRIIRVLEVPVTRYKVVGAWAGEKLGRFKPNGRLLGGSRLRTVVELEAMLLGARGKALLWDSLLIRAEDDDRLDPEALRSLIARADRQIEVLRDHHDHAVREALGGGRLQGD